MSDAPPPQFAQYPRGPEFRPLYGTAERLAALGDGYFGLNAVFIANMVAVFSARRLLRDVEPMTLVAIIAVFALVIGALTFPFNRKIAIGKVWPPAYAFLASFLMGLNSALCCGIVGFIVMQQIAMNEMKKYGVTAGFFGLNRRTFNGFLEARRAHDAGTMSQA